MRTGPNNRRPRSRGNGNNRRHSSHRVQNFESSGPESKVRGNAHQLVEKYLQLSRDASSMGDRITAENFSQHAEHYFRMHMGNNAASDGRQSGSQDRGGNGAERGTPARRNRGGDGGNAGNGKESGAEAAGNAEPGGPQSEIPGTDPAS